MRKLFAIFVALFAQQATSAEILVGTATLKYQSQPKYQPGSCETRSPAEAAGEICINMWPWLLHEVVGFRDLKGQARRVGSLVVTAHQSLSGEWLLVLEKLSDEEAAKFGAQYKIVDRSPIKRTACLDRSVENYTGEPSSIPKVAQAEGLYCYDMSRVPRE